MTFSKIIVVCIASITLASCSGPQEKLQAASVEQPPLESNFVQSSPEKKTQQHDFLAIKKRMDKDIYPSDSLLAGDRLWYVEDEGIYSYHLSTNKLNREAAMKGFNEIRAFNNNIWFYFQQIEGSDYNNITKPLVRYDIENKKLISYSEKDLRLGPSITVYSDENIAWIGSDNGVISINLATNKVKKRYGIKRVTGINGSNKMVYFGTRDGSIHTYDKATQQFGRLQTTKQLQGAQIDELRWLNGKLMVIWGDSDENIGVSLFDEATKSWDEFVYQDAPGKVWSDQLNSFQMELFTEDKGTEIVNYSWTDATKPLKQVYKIPLSTIVDMVTINERYILISTIADGINVLDKSTGDIIWKTSEKDWGTLHKVRDSEYVMITSEGIYDILLRDIE